MYNFYCRLALRQFNFCGISSQVSIANISALYTRLDSQIYFIVITLMENVKL